MLRVIIVGPVVKCYVTDLFRRSKSFPRHYFFSGFCVKNIGNALVDNIACQICALSNGDSDFHRMNLISLTDTYPCWNCKIDQLVNCRLVIRANLSILILYTVIHSYIFFLIVPFQMCHFISNIEFCMHSSSVLKSDPLFPSWFSVEVKKQSSCTVHLVNKSHEFVAFKVCQRLWCTSQLLFPIFYSKSFSNCTNGLILQCPNFQYYV